MSAPERVPGVHQFHSGSAYGDAVTNGMLLFREHFHAFGLQSEIYVEHLDPLLADRLRPFDELSSLGVADILIIHHSMGHDRLDALLALPCRKVLAYHNITPAHFFAPGSPFHRYSRLGREMLTAMLGRVEAVIADSEYNADELRTIGFHDVEVLPVLVDERKFASIECPGAQQDAIGRPWTVLFVGRICENKGHLDLLPVAAQMARGFGAPFRFRCIGSYDENDAYYVLVRKRIVEAGLERCFEFSGKVSDDDLRKAYAQADCYLSLSGHEGFGVPLIEAMLCRLPVLALDRSCVAETLAGAGILLSAPDPEIVVPALERLLLDRAYRRELIGRQFERAKALTWMPIHARVSALLWRLEVVHPTLALKIEPTPPPLDWRIEGPFDSTYSLAILNRELARSLDRIAPERVALFSTEGPGDFPPDLRRVADPDGRLGELVRRSNAAVRPEVVVRNLYPPRVRDMRGEWNAGFFAWEESSIPFQTIDDFNMSVDVVFTISDFVSEALRVSGCRVPIHTIGAGVDHLLAVEPKPLSEAIGSGYRFLNVSSGFPRKGLDVLIEAFCRTFTEQDDVTLVIKTFPNPHNVTRADVEHRRTNPRCPRIVLLEGDMPAGELVTLYQSCHAYVSPSRAEGFGLPIAEAMLAGLPVVVTGWGGHRQFCSPDTALLIDYHLEQSTSHLAAVDALWAVPDVDSLSVHLRALASGQDSGVARRVANARKLLLDTYRWDHVADRAIRAISLIKSKPPTYRPIRLGWVTTWNERCGIANYSKFLVERLSPYSFDTTIFGKIGSSKSDGTVPYVSAWNAPPVPSEPLHESLLRAAVDCVVIQFNFGYFDVLALARTIEVLDAHGVATIVMFHSTKDVVRPGLSLSLRAGLPGLSKAAALLVHSAEDLERLRGFGLGDRTSMFPQGVLNRPRTSRTARRQMLGIAPEVRIVATFGFMLPHKGLLEMCDAIRELARQGDEVHWFAVNALYPIEASSELAGEIVDRVERYGLASRVRVFTDFLDDEVALRILEVADLVVFPYQETAESSSAAVRYGLSSGRPVAVTPLAIFDDVSGAVTRLSGFDAVAIAADIKRLLVASPEDRPQASAQTRFMNEADWGVLARRLSGIITTKVRDARSSRASFERSSVDRTLEHIE